MTNRPFQTRRLLVSFAAVSMLAGGAEIAAAAPLTRAGAVERSEPVHCSTWSLRETVGEEAWASTAKDMATRGGPCAATPVGPPPNPQVGDSWNWYIWRLNGSPMADLESCTVRGMGDTATSSSRTRSGT